MKSVIIQGSSRSTGHTYLISQLIQQQVEADFIDLKEYEIHPYSYEHEHVGDDFLPLMRKLITYDTFIFITPVYWYAMSGIMKNFFDRITDCLKVEKELGRKLRGKQMLAVSCGSEAEEVEGFFVPFSKSADYLGMQYLGALHTWVLGGEVESEVEARVRNFFNK